MTDKKVLPKPDGYLHQHHGVCARYSEDVPQGEFIPVLLKKPEKEYEGWTIEPVWLSTTPPISKEEAIKKAEEFYKAGFKECFEACWSPDDAELCKAYVIESYMRAWLDITGAKS